MNHCHPFPGLAVPTASGGLLCHEGKSREDLTLTKLQEVVTVEVEAEHEEDAVRPEELPGVVVEHAAEEVVPKVSHSIKSLA